MPNPFNRQTGEVTALEWSSDGYVLAVGWKHGWGLFSVGGKCLASGIGVNEFVEEERCTTMHYKLFQRFILGLDFGTSSCMVFEIWQVFMTHKKIGPNQLFYLQFWGPGNFELFLLSTSMHRSKYFTLLIT